MAKSEHWADQTAQRIIKQRGPKDRYTCAAGITPSGTVHIGNFREIISVELVSRALKDADVPVRFIYSWDDYDAFRKVPKNMPNPEALGEFLRKPITDIPDPWGSEESYARANEVAVEKVLPELGVHPEYLYQAERYRASMYAEGIRKALLNVPTIRTILDRYRDKPLPDSWWPISVFSSFTGKDTTEVLSFDGAYGVTYRCKETGNTEELDLRTTSRVKLLWRIDWPMRWVFEDVDFEPAGKEHHSAGGSFDTAKAMVQEVYDGKPPATFKYDFISIKGMGGKISSSLGNVVDLSQVLEIYEPQVVRYLFAGTRPNAEFAISFDLDVIKIYEDYDRCERIAFGKEEVGEARAAKERRTWELSQIDEIPETMPRQLAFRHLSSVVQITDGNLDEALKLAGVTDGVGDSELLRLRRRAACAWTWVRKYAPEDYRFTLVRPDARKQELSDQELEAVQKLYALVEKGFEGHNEKSLAEAIYAIAEEVGLEPKNLFALFYRVLVNNTKGPRLAGFLLTVGAPRIEAILGNYVS